MKKEIKCSVPKGLKFNFPYKIDFLLNKLKMELTMDYFELECAVEEWAKDKGIFDKATPMAQALKTLEETTELCTAINNNDPEEIADAMGDIMVTLIIQAKMQGVTLEKCLEGAYKIIAERKGKMINGQFVKESDLPKYNWDEISKEEKQILKQNQTYTK